MHDVREFTNDPKQEKVPRTTRLLLIVALLLNVETPTTPSVPTPPPSNCVADKFSILKLKGHLPIKLSDSHFLNNSCFQDFLG